MAGGDQLADTVDPMMMLFAMPYPTAQRCEMARRLRAPPEGPN